LACYCIRLANLLRLQAVALQHIVEVGVSADIELHRTLQLHPAFPEEARQHAMDNGGSDLALDIVADQWQIGFLEALLPVLLTCNKDRNAVDKPYARPRKLANMTR